MPNLADITTLNSTNAPRLLRAVFVLERDLLDVPSTDDTSTIRQEISLAANTESYALYHTRETEQFTERKEVTAAGKRYEQTLRINVPRSRAAIDAVLDAIGTNKVAVAFVDRNGAARLVRRLRLQHELTIASGNGYQLTFAGESKTFAAYLTQNVFNALAGDAEYIEDEDVINDPNPLAVGEKLYVWYSAGTAATYAAARDWYIDLGGNTLSIKGDIKLPDLGTGTDAGIVAYDANNKLLKSQLITTNGTNIGIGKANPVHKLDILGGNIQINNGGATWFGSDATGGFVRTLNNDTFRFLNAGGTERMRIIGSSGNVGIGTTNPPYKLTVQGDTYVYGGNLHLSSAPYGIVNAANVSQKLSFPSLGNFAFENVNVGIGTINPTEKFEVSGGNVKFSTYGLGTITGTPSTFLAFESDGKLIEYTLQDFFALVPEYATNLAAAAVLAVGETYYNTTTATYTKVI